MKKSTENKLTIGALIVTGLLCIPPLFFLLGCSEGIIPEDPLSTDNVEERSIPSESNIRCFNGPLWCLAELSENVWTYVLSANCDFDLYFQNDWVIDQDGWHDGCLAGHHPNEVFPTYTFCISHTDPMAPAAGFDQTKCFAQVEDQWYAEILPTCDTEYIMPVNLWGNFPQECELQNPSSIGWDDLECQGPTCMGRLNTGYSILIRPMCFLVDDEYGPAGHC